MLGNRKQNGKSFGLTYTAKQNEWMMRSLKAGLNYRPLHAKSTWLTCDIQVQRSTTELLRQHGSRNSIKQYDPNMHRADLGCPVLHVSPTVY